MDIIPEARKTILKKSILIIIKIYILISSLHYLLDILNNYLPFFYRKARLFPCYRKTKTAFFDLNKPFKTIMINKYRRSLAMNENPEWIAGMRQLRMALPLALFILLITVHSIHAQVAPSSFNMIDVDATALNQDNVPGFGNNYPTTSTYNLRFGQTPTGTGQNLRVSSFVYNGDTYTNILPPTVESPYEYVIINRVNNNAVDYEKVTAFFSRSQTLSGTVASETTLYYDPDYVATMEELINSFNANQGSDNLFANDNSSTLNNIERVDLILFQGGVSTTVPNETGFLVMERGGNDNYKVAAITGLNPDGTVASLGTLVLADHVGAGGVWGSTGRSVMTTVFQSVKSGTPPLMRPSQNLGTQIIAGSYVSFGHMEIDPGQVIYGFSLFPGDVTETMDLIGLTDVPLDTDGASASTGGLDFMAGGGFFVDDESTVNFNSAVLTEGSCWRTLSSPVSGISYATLLGDFWTQGIEGSKNPGAHPSNANVYVLNEDGDDWVALSSMNSIIPPGTGFLISVFDEDGSGNPGTWPKVLSVSGTENVAPVTVSGLPANSDDLDTPADGFAILGNPFKSAIDLNVIGDPNENNLTGVFRTFYVYDRNFSPTTPYEDRDGNLIPGGWVSWAIDEQGNATGDITDGIIRPYQGFVVQTSTDTGTRSVIFPESAKTIGGQFYGKRPALRDYIRFEAENNYLYNSMWVRFSDLGSKERVSGDALEMSPMTEDYILFGTRKQDGTLFDIGLFPMPHPDTEIPVGFEATLPGTYTIRITEMDLSSGLSLYFNDRLTGKSLQIDESFTYKFSNDRPAKSASAPVPCGVLEPHLAKTTTSDDRFFISPSPMEFPSELPETVYLAQNYPNPFNPSTVIRFEIPEAGHVRLAVYDMLGRQVEVLVDGNREPGSYRAEWDATRISSGSYIYRLETNGVSVNRVMTLVR